MTNTSGNSWTAEIPQQQNGDTIAYYIHASDQSPRNETHPLIGEPDPHKFYLFGTTTVVEEKEITKAIVFPNPAVDYIYIQMCQAKNSSAQIRLYDILGKEVMAVDEKNLNERMLRLDVTELQAGTYFLSIRSGNFKETRKIMVMH